MEQTPKGARLHIAIFGRRNTGKSSLINALTNQEIALVSDVAGTTTDPVYKSMEILPIGPVMMIDTPGVDDVGELGILRIERTQQVLHKADLAILVFESQRGITNYEQTLLEQIKEKNIPSIGVINKSDILQLTTEEIEEWQKQVTIPLLPISVKNNTGIDELKKLLIQYTPEDWQGPAILGDLLQEGDMVVLVTPIDSAAPKGRLILPQVQTIRDILDYNGMSMVVKEDRLKQALAKLSELPRMVVTDSQAFAQVSSDTPPEVLLTSFSILFARYKGDLETLVQGVKSIESLQPGDKILIAEACTHHRQTDDIGTKKIPQWLEKKVGGKLDFAWVSGTHFPENLEKYSLVVHCGACMLNRREMMYRLSQVREKGVPIVNYGLLIAYVHGILERALEPFPHIQKILQG